MKKNYADYLLKKTKDDYNRIAPVFSSKRSYLEPDWPSLVKYAKPGDRVLDLGCGNGRLSELFSRDIHYLGVDISNEMLKIAKAKYPNSDFQLINFLSLPFLAESFDVIYCLAVLHHVPLNSYRLKFLKEIQRVLKSKARVIISVWDLKANWRIRFTQFLQFPLRYFSFSSLDVGDLFYNFQDSQGRLLAKRYVHAFTLTELKNLLIEAGFKVDNIYIQKRGRHQNIIAICSKTNG